ncbi:mRNA cap methyltransferase [Verticillium dahliae VdLs.17]|uniref:mRNA cap guanine-N(7) methyltransferase n=1 Tax=Verticillium dahliae (strain VdLs.17 / ATCC MYA-4575 / FGSC 10137) TaxID=498257 RepID=G2X5N1_VERDV|nr:mRNA cap methyltransferase [Verticillium dahliae VdLs.17]EGY14372.1 mRNA cap methyltransferase [Verticillium dahliae VdLs.17]
MADDRYGDEENPQPYSANNLDPPRKRKAENTEELPQPYNAKELQPAKRRAMSPNEHQPRKQKRPGARARISEAEREAIRQRALERDRALEAAALAAPLEPRQRGINDVVTQHYNSVPERGRDWRRTDSKIKGLRSFNNWVKSCIIQKFSPDEDYTPASREQGRSGGHELLVLDIGCGKGGDLGKWQQAPQPVQLYVGLDPADVSIDQARERYRQMSSRGGGGRGGRGGHRRPPPRIQTTASSMSKTATGGRLVGCIPNSDVLGEHRTPEPPAEAEDGELEEGEAEETAEWGNSIYRVRFPGKTPEDGIFRPAFGWKYNFFLDEAVEEVPEYVVPWEAFRALAEDFNLELQYQKNFMDVWNSEKDDPTLGPLSERMGVRERGGGDLLVSPDEQEAASFYIAFCFYKV